MKNIIKKSLVNINYSLSKSRKSKSIFFHDVHSKNEYVKNGDVSTPIEKFANYGFNKSHAVSYSIISYQCAWLCNYFPRPKRFKTRVN